MLKFDNGQGTFINDVTEVVDWDKYFCDALYEGASKTAILV